MMLQARNIGEPQIQLLASFFLANSRTSFGVTDDFSFKCPKRAENGLYDPNG